MTSENSGKTNLISCGKNWKEKYHGRIQEPKSCAGGQERQKKKLSVTDGQTDRPTDRRIEWVVRVACTRLITENVGKTLEVSYAKKKKIWGVFLVKMKMYFNPRNAMTL